MEWGKDSRTEPSPSRKLQSDKDPMGRGGAVVIHKLHASGATPPPHHMVPSPIHTPVPHFLKVSIMSLCSYERPILVPIFAIWKTSKEDLRFCKNSSVFVLTAVAIRGSRHPKQRERPHQAPSREPHSASQHLTTRGRGWVSEHLCSTLCFLSKMSCKVSEKPM